MTKKLSAFCASCFLLLFLYSCASTPKPAEQPAPAEQPKQEPTTPAETTPPVAEPVKPSVPLPEAQYAEAKQLRDTVAKYDLSKYAPDKFSAAEEKFGVGEKAYGTDNESSTAALEEAVAGYRAVVDIGADSILSGLQSDTEASRAAAAEAGAESSFPDQFAFAAKRFDAAVSQRAAKNYEDAGARYGDAKNLFDSLALKMEILALNETMAAYDLESYIPTEAAEARMMYLAGDDVFETDSAASKKSFAASRDAAAAALDKAAVLVTGVAQGSAEGARSRADSVKASIAMKSEYADAMSAYSDGVKALKAKDYVNAYKLLGDAARRFDTVYRLVLEKKDRAETAIVTGKQEIIKLETLARDAENDLQTSGAIPAESTK